MPLYEYTCKKCGDILNVKHKMSEKPEVCSDVIECADDGPLEKNLSKSLSQVNTTSGKQKSGEVSEEALAERVENHIEHLRYEAKITKDEMKSSKKKEISKTEIRDIVRRNK